MEILCLGLNHKLAGIEVREKFAFSNKRAQATLETLVRTGGIQEALILSTCNRVEFYVVANHRQTVHDLLFATLSEQSGITALQEDWFYYHHFPKSAEHLFQVVSGLDSMMLGETEILGQVKHAYRLAQDAGTTGRFLNRLFQRSFQVAKHVRTKTGITQGAVSVGAAAVELASKIFGNLSQQRAMILGAGEIGEKTARSLISRGVESVIVSNRSYDRAERIAEELRGQAIHFDDWPSYMDGIDILISSTAAPHTVVSYQVIAELMKKRAHRPLFIIDLAVPRDVEPEVNELESVYLYDIDALESIAERAVNERKREIISCNSIISSYLEELNNWFTRERNRLSLSAPLSDASLGNTITSQLCLQSE